MPFRNSHVLRGKRRNGGGHVDDDRCSEEWKG